MQPLTVKALIERSRAAMWDPFCRRHGGGPDRIDESEKCSCGMGRREVKAMVTGHIPGGWEPTTTTDVVRRNDRGDRVALDRVPLLDHGYIELVELWGSDERIIEAARMSTQKGFEGWGPKCSRCGSTAEEASRGMGQSTCDYGVHDFKAGDEKLLAYLWKNKHTTPFEMAGAVVKVQAPIMVFREWMRHRTQSYSEMSARYAPLPNLDYVPSIERLMLNAKSGNKQAGAAPGAAELTEEQARHYIDALREVYATNELLYQEALKGGIPKELARLHLPFGRYSRMQTTANLRNWLHFLSLRMDKAAQWEIRQYANALHDILRDVFPRTLALFDEGRQP